MTESRPPNDKPRTLGLTPPASLRAKNAAAMAALRERLAAPIPQRDEIIDAVVDRLAARLLAEARAEVAQAVVEENTEAAVRLLPIIAPPQLRLVGCAADEE